MVTFFNKASFSNVIIALLCSFIFASALPLEVEDIQNYLNRIILIDSDEYVPGIFFIWDEFFLVVYNLVGEKYLIFSIRFILYLFLTLTCLKELNLKVYIVLILVSPFIIEHFLGGLRQGLAFVLFITAYYNSNKIVRICIFGAIVFIHPLALWWLGTYLLALFAFKFNSKFILFGLSIFCFLMLKSVFSSPYVQSILMYGERYEFADSGRSVFGLLFWILILFLTLLIKERKLHTYVVILSLLQLIILYNNFESIYRFFQSLLPIFLIYNLNNYKNKYSKIIILLYTLFVGIHFTTYYPKLLL